MDLLGLFMKALQSEYIIYYIYSFGDSSRLSEVHLYCVSLNYMKLIKVFDN